MVVMALLVSVSAATERLWHALCADLIFIALALKILCRWGDSKVSVRVSFLLSFTDANRHSQVQTTIHTHTHTHTHTYKHPPTHTHTYTGVSVSCPTPSVST